MPAGLTASAMASRWSATPAPPTLLTRAVTDEEITVGGARGGALATKERRASAEGRKRRALHRRGPGSDARYNRVPVSATTLALSFWLSTDANFAAPPAVFEQLSRSSPPPQYITKMPAGILGAHQFVAAAAVRQRPAAAPGRGRGGPAAQQLLRRGEGRRLHRSWRLVKAGQVDPVLSAPGRALSSSNEPAGTIVIDPQITSSIPCRRAAARCATASGSAGRASAGPGLRTSATSRNGRTGIRRRR